jgi:hypothetical protein
MLHGIFCRLLGMGQDVLFLQNPSHVLGLPSRIANEQDAAKVLGAESWVWARVYCSSKSPLRSLGVTSLTSRMLQGLFCWVLGKGQGGLFLQKPPQVLGGD